LRATRSRHDRPGAFADRVALVTGGAASIGRAIVEDLAARGASVVIADRDGPAARQVASELERRGARALAVETDVLDATSVSEMLQAALGRFGAVDCLVNNAGCWGRSSRCGRPPTRKWSACST
jgi:NAD(P)-dependent dehydrogenase (short-subunit alcohol dehydrogenase family)